MLVSLAWLRLQARISHIIENHVLQGLLFTSDKGGDEHV
jgi:hypothetical protein